MHIYMNIKHQIQYYIGKTLDRATLSDDLIEESLIALGMDSIKFISLIVTIEDEFNIEIPDELLLLQELDTPQKIITLTEQLVNESMFNGA